MNQVSGNSAGGDKHVLVSVVVPVLNDARLRYAIESVLSQTCTPAPELIVVDAGSTDDTLNVIAEYRDRISVLVQEPDQGIFDGINKGNRLASGDVIAFLGSDDRYADTSVLEDVTSLFADEELDICYGDVVYVDENENLVRYWKTNRYSFLKLCFGWQTPHPGTFIRKQVFDCIGPFDTSYPITADYDFFARLFVQHRFKEKYFQRTIAKLALGGSSSSFVKGSIEVARAIWRLRLYGAFLAPLFKPARKLLQHRSVLHSSSIR